MKALLLVAGLLLAAVVATLFRYQSLHPCDWMERDLTEAYGLPALVAQAQIRAAFLLEGVTEPDALDCLLKWWDWRSEGIPE
jgi:hypothetical protein